MSKRCSDSEDDTPPRPLKKRCNIKLKFKDDDGDDDGDDGNGEKGDDKNKEN